MTAEESEPRCANPAPHERHMVPFQVEGRYSAFTCPGVRDEKERHFFGAMSEPLSGWRALIGTPEHQEMQNQVFYVCEGSECRYCMKPRRVLRLKVGKDVYLAGPFVCSACGRALARISEWELEHFQDFSDECIECGSGVDWNVYVSAVTCKANPSHLWWEES